MRRIAQTLTILLISLSWLGATSGAQAAPVVSFSGFAGIGPLGGPGGATGLTSLGFTGGDVFVSAPAGNLTNPPAADAATLGAFTISLGAVTSPTGVASLTTPLTFTQIGVGSADFTVTNPAAITNITTNAGPFTSTTLIATTTLTSSTIPDLGPIGSTWNLILTFQGAYTFNDGVQGTVDIPPNGTISGSYTFNNVAAFVPEPGTLALFGGAVLLGGYFARRRLSPMTR